MDTYLSGIKERTVTLQLSQSDSILRSKTIYKYTNSEDKNGNSVGD